VRSDAGNSSTTDAGAKKAPHAGDVKIAGLRDITLTPGEKGVYSSKVENTDVKPFFETGSEVKFSAPGADVPTFETTLKGPSLITVTAPALSSGTYKLSRNEDLPVAWKGGTVGDVTAVVSSVTTTASTTISCKFKANAGTGTIPKAALGKLAPTTGDAANTIEVEASSSEEIEHGDWRITAILKTGGTMVFFKFNE
jgi:hypothetical protein